MDEEFEKPIAFCQIYSQSKQKWFKAQILSITLDDEGQWLHVKYGNSSTKEIQIFSPEIRRLGHKQDVLIRFDIFLMDKYICTKPQKHHLKYKNIMEYIMNQQKLLLFGYLNGKNGLNVSMDVMDLIGRFYELNVFSIDKQINKNNPKSIMNIWSLASTLSSDYDAHCISNTMLSLILSIYKPSPTENPKKTKSIVYATRSMVLVRWNLHNEAVMDMIAAIQCDPKNAKYKYLFGKYLYNQCNYKEALKQLVIAIKTKFDWNYDIYYKAAMCCVKLKKPCQAIFYFNTSIKSSPASYLPYYKYAEYVRDYMKDYKLSEKLHEMCLNIDETQITVHGSYGYLLYLMGKYLKAKKHLEIEMNLCRKKKYDNMWGCYYLGLLNKTLGDNKKANDSINKSIQLIDKSFSKRQRLDFLLHLECVIKADPENMDFHQKFKSAMKQHLPTIK